MASCHAIGPASAAFPAKGRRRLRTADKAVSRFALLPWPLSGRALALRSMNGFSLSCRAAVPVAPPEEATIGSVEGNGDPVAELWLCPSSARAAAVEIEREEDAACSPQSSITAESLGRWMQESVPVADVH